MYYEEKIINGVLSYRISPESDWIQFSAREVTERLIKVEEKQSTMHTKEQVNHLLLQMHTMIFAYTHCGRECIYKDLCDDIGFEIPKEKTV